MTFSGKADTEPNSIELKTVPSRFCSTIYETKMKKIRVKTIEDIPDGCIFYEGEVGSGYTIFQFEKLMFKGKELENSLTRNRLPPAGKIEITGVYHSQNRYILLAYLSRNMQRPTTIKLSYHYDESSKNFSIDHLSMISDSIGSLDLSAKIEPPSFLEKRTETIQEILDAIKIHEISLELANYNFIQTLFMSLGPLILINEGLDEPKTFQEIDNVVVKLKERYSEIILNLPDYSINKDSKKALLDYLSILPKGPKGTLKAHFIFKDGLNIKELQTTNDSFNFLLLKLMKKITLTVSYDEKAIFEPEGLMRKPE